MILNLAIHNNSSSQTITACDQYNWNGMVYSTSGTYYDTIPNAAGCDSVMKLILSIKNSTSSSQTTSACKSYSWNGSTYTQSGTYYDTIPNTAGCDSIMTLSLNLNKVDTSVSVVGNSLIAHTNGAKYQWLNCGMNYQVISGATNQKFTPSATGNYAVEITESNCIDTSACYDMIAMELDNQMVVHNFDVYPNPTSGLFTIERGAIQNTHYQLTSILGKCILEGMLSSEKTIIDLRDYENGIYFLCINGETIKLIKH
ncbi:MAG: T9SS type A sorting domain-containing protein [Bacteroidetes bacterium]|nr:T9SS type A sorting domain-containing protein [Bacteroidota bacterium]